MREAPLFATLKTEAQVTLRLRESMGAAAHTLPVDRQSDWLVELERILDDWNAISIAAQDAVCLVVESLLEDPGNSEADVAQAVALLAHLKRARLRPTQAEPKAQQVHQVVQALA